MQFAHAQLIEWGLFGGIGNKAVKKWAATFKTEDEFKRALVEGVAGKIAGTHDRVDENGITSFVKVR